MRIKVEKHSPDRNRSEKLMPAPDGDPRLYFNGIDGATGDYLVPPLSPHEVAALARGEPIDPKQLKELKEKVSAATEAPFVVVEGVDPSRVEQAGWGVIFAGEAGPTAGLSASAIR